MMMIDYSSRFPCELVGSLLWPESNNKEAAEKDCGERIETILSFAETSKANRQKIKTSFFWDILKNKRNLFRYDPLEIAPNDIPHFLFREHLILKNTIFANKPTLTKFSIRLDSKKPNAKQLYLADQVWSTCVNLPEDEKKIITGTQGEYKCIDSSPDYFVFNKGQTVFIYSRVKKRLQTRFSVQGKIDTLRIREELVFTKIETKKMSVFDIQKNERKFILVYPWYVSGLLKSYLGKTHLLFVETDSVFREKGELTKNFFSLVPLDSIATCAENCFPRILVSKKQLCSLDLNIVPEDENFIAVSLEADGYKIFRIFTESKTSIRIKVLDKKTKLLRGPDELGKKAEKLWKVFYQGGYLFAAIGKEKGFNIRKCDLKSKEVKKIYSKKDNLINSTKMGFFGPNCHSIYFCADLISSYKKKIGVNKKKSVGINFDFPIKNLQAKVQPIEKLESSVDEYSL